MKKVMLVFGTRPEAIKMAPLVHAFQEAADITPLVVVTAQHREMLDQVLTLFNIVPDYDLNLMQPGQTLSSITAGVLTGLEEVMQKEAPDLVLVHGDTTTTFAASLAAFYSGIAVGHVEAGLRSGDKKSPFPEEANRCLTSVLTELHLAPTEAAKANLLNEGISEKNIFITGNTVIDALATTVAKDYTFPEGPVAEALNKDGQKILLTAHRRENQGAPMQRIFKAVNKLLQEDASRTLIFPVHMNPKIRQWAEEAFGDNPQVIRTEPLDYEPFVALMKAVDLIFTDSGGLQEEAPSLGKPVLVLRDNTERPEAVAAGTVKLVGTDENMIYQTAEKLLTDETHYQAMAQAVNPYGDGQAAQRTVAAVRHILFGERRPSDYQVGS